MFLSAGNLVNLLVQGSVFVLLGMAEIWVLVLGEIDLSVGYVAGIGGTVAAILSTTHNLPWWVAVIIAMLTTAAIGAVWGTLVIRLRLPSFVVTLAGLLGMEGVLLYLVNANGTGGTIRITDNVLLDVTDGNLSPVAGWILMVATVAVFGAVTILRDRHRRVSGLVAPPLAVTLLKVGVMAAAGVALVLVCNTDRGVLVPLRGVPYVVLVVLGFLAVWTFLLGRTRFGRYLYAIGNNAEAARRAGISLGWNRLWAFTLTGLTAGVGRHRLRLPAGLDLQQHRRRHAGPLRRGLGRHRRGQPLRRPGQDGLRPARRPGHRHHLQRHGPDRSGRLVPVHGDRPGAAGRRDHRLTGPSRSHVQLTGAGPRLHRLPGPVTATAP